MDTKQYMIVDLERRGDKKMFITEQVTSIHENKNGHWSVRFSTSARVFNYTPSRLLYLTRPEVIDLGEKGFYIKKRHITDVMELLRFTNGQHTFYRATYSNGYHENFEEKEVYITRTPIDKNGGGTWDYLCKLADESGLTTENGSNILSMQYNLVDVKRDNVPLAQYLGNKTKLTKHHIPKLIYYPFGCNASQKSAVEAALTHQVSIIQGPPGTGKTQTILNIIANLLIADKTVLVVSNNNSAVENVAEKLMHVNLDFIVAKLGCVQNKEEFITCQQEYPDMSEWIINELSSVKHQVKDSLLTISQGFDTQKEQARLRVEYDALKKEAKYNEMIETNSAEWLYSKKSAYLLKLLNIYQMITESNRKPNFWLQLKWALKLGVKTFTFLKKQPSDIIRTLETAYYFSRRKEIELELEKHKSTLQTININQNIQQLRLSSLQLLRNRMALRYSNPKRRKFTQKDIKPRTEEFLKEYPVVLSTTYSAKNCISKDMVFDYVIMDEASQVDIKTGVLVLSCAQNIVIVGDDKQLPNVVNYEEALAIDAIRATYNIDDKYNAATHSFLQSCIEVFDTAPVTLLQEHYRCHPKIIEFCNQRFYNGELITMTTDQGEDKVLQVVRTVKGNHAREHFNQREIDVIVREIMPEYTDQENVGIITPYHRQAVEINKALGKDIASTVHKYQGRECDTIIMSLVDNTPTKFSDDDNLLNVAISRAKKHLCIVTSGNEIPQETNLAQLIAYIHYNNFEIKESKLHSVFDLLYKQYTAERLAYKSVNPTVSEQFSEVLIYNLLKQSIKELGKKNMEVLCHYPLSKLIGDRNLLDGQEKSFADNPLTHVDFLVYNSFTKQPLIAIEVDGWNFHKGNNVQLSRDTLKDRILAKIGLTLHRLSTTDTVNQETLIAFLQ